MIRINKLYHWNKYYREEKNVIPPVIPESQFFIESTFAFDAVYVTALALNKTIPRQGSNSYHVKNVCLHFVFPK